MLVPTDSHVSFAYFRSSRGQGARSVSRSVSLFAQESFFVSLWVFFFSVHRKGEKRRLVPRKTSANVVSKAVILRSPTAEEARGESTDRRGETF